ncbi:putative mitochondrial protein [Vitis vinifera]|uniref:Putative mitochondrial protein n=1 Tax=Vitis vinifera TaxID=29760 RepID=A0A438DB20_VITVI|nr:putative mitochondrial protein [Vitis vinifera]
MTTKNQIFTSVISGSPMITSEKLVGSENYLSWSASVELWFMGQGYEDHLVTQEADIPEIDRIQWRKIDAQLCSVLWQSVDPRILLHLQAYKTCFKFWTQAKGLYTNDIQRLYKVTSAIVHISQQDLDLSTYIGQIASLKEQFLTVMPLTPDVGAQQTQLDKFFMVLTLIGLRPDLEPIRDQILGSSSVSSLDDVFARLLRISSTQTLPSDSASDSSVLVSQTTSRGGRSGTRGRGQRPHCTYCNKLGHTRDRCYQLHGRPLALPIWPNPLILRCLQPPSSSASQTSQASIASVAQPDSGASDHLSGNKDLFSSITTTSDLPTVTLANGSQTVAKGIGLALSLLLYLSLLSFILLNDRSTGKTIGIGRESQGLYHLTSDSSPAVCISTDAPLLIHNRLATLVSPSSRRWFLVFPLCRRFRDKLSAKAMKCLFLGYSRLQKGYRCYSLETHRYFISSDVTFFEDSPFFSTTSESLPVSEVLPIPIVSPPDAMPPRPLQVYHRRPQCRCSSPFFLRHLLTHFLSLRLHLPRLCLLLMIYPLLFGKSTHEALSHLGWRQAMVDEMAALHSNGTWDLVVLPSGKSTVGCRWVYAVKVGPDGQIASVCLLLSMAAMCSWPLYQLDIKNAFLHGDLARKFIWSNLLVLLLRGSLCIYLVVYVDDIVITSSDQDGIQKLKQHLFTHFQTKDFGETQVFLGIEITQSSSGVVLSKGSQGVLYENRGHTQVVGYTDADWAGSPTDRRSTSGYCVFIGGNLISWKSKKQDVVARSSAEAEYQAMALATCELIWMRHLLRELRFGKG